MVSAMTDRQPRQPSERSAVVDLSAVQHNVRRLAELARGRTLIAVVKADAYGHGAVPVARAVLEAVSGAVRASARPDLPVLAKLSPDVTDLVAVVPSVVFGLWGILYLAPKLQGFFRNLHNWMAGGIAEKAFKDALAALKPGGILGVEEHRGQPGRVQDVLNRPPEGDPLLAGAHHAAEDDQIVRLSS